MLCYFKAEGQKIQSIEKDVQLSEDIIRVLILSTDEIKKEDIEKDTPATKVEKEKAILERPQEAEVSEQGDQQEEPAAEQIQIVDEAKTIEDVEQAGETEQAEEVEAEEPQDSQPKVSSDD